MKKQFIVVFVVFAFVIHGLNAQVKGTKLGYIDMEYILQNVPDYIEAKNQLEQRTQKWKIEIDTKRNEINSLKEALKAEKTLLTKELIEERETEIRFLENENLEYQQKRFGPNGDLIAQKETLIKPIQDQVFTAVQDIADRLKYDFIFDKSSDLTMLFAAKKFDISDQVLRVLTRAEKREQLTKKQLKDAEARESKEDADANNELVQERQKVLEEKKTARDKAFEERKALQEQKKKEFEDNKKRIQEERLAKKNGTVLAKPTSDDATKTATNEASKTTQKTEEVKLNSAEEKKKIFEERKKALEDKKKKILEDREAQRKAKEDLQKKNTNNN
ncbi:OmpH family outer membrane protein [Flavobacterium sp. CHNK8]|uniref:OmpH family outer membrane protein n=1 Tax=Flavobacterium sp. CHNK8 TaxID=2871165 RepID=UPI001C8D436F|nr:OmpH family outer membrane protein [Flavobacterium sp. CHNK8]QZK91371.1 OmpH family outer membrane protein [Flavobacterium sp. CHNK8]